MKSDVIRPGRYRHYKGNHYDVIGVARHSETGEVHVVYRPLYGSERSLWLRPLSMFSGIVELEGESVARFVYDPENTTHT